MTREEKIDAIERCVSIGLSASQIAAELGAVSRNAIIGFSFRNKVRLRPPILRGDVLPSKWKAKPVSEIAAERARRGKAQRSKKVKPKQPPASVLVPVAPVKAQSVAVPIPRSDAVHLLNLASRSQCRFPVWPDRMGTRQKVSADEALFCGCQVVEGSSYCPEHHPIVWDRAPKKAPKPRQQKPKINTAYLEGM